VVRNNELEPNIEVRFFGGYHQRAIVDRNEVSRRINFLVRFPVKTKIEKYSFEKIKIFVKKNVLLTFIIQKFSESLGLSLIFWGLKYFNFLLRIPDPVPF
jgi:hypothetical protein